MTKNILIIYATINADNFLFNYETCSNGTHSGIVQGERVEAVKIAPVGIEAGSH
jgi:hypothetical protein